MCDRDKAESSSSLQHLLLSTNNFAGDIPSGLSRCRELSTGETVAVKRIVHMENDVLVRRHLVKLLWSLCHDWLHGGSGVRWQEAGAKLGPSAQSGRGLVQGVEYLHHDCVPRVVHRDIKCSNVLLDGGMDADLDDLKLSPRIAMAARPAPKCAYSLKATEKTDVYSTGIVLMELVTGLLSTDKTFGGDMDMVRWVQSRAARAGARPHRAEGCQENATIEGKGA
ncbi:hypothetical protein ACQ4PT_035132 [Festuca glaucescens]